MKLSRHLAMVAVALSASFALAASHPDGPTPGPSGTPGSDAQKSFDTLKALQGNWEGKNSQGQTIKVSFRSTAGGSALMNEIHGMGPENMITMFHMDGERLMMTHYCGAGNQPRMKATLAPDAKSVAFDFIDATNLASPDAGHMQHVVFAMPDSDHHTEEWTFLDHGKEMKELFTLQRSK